MRAQVPIPRQSPIRECLSLVKVGSGAKRVKTESSPRRFEIKLLRPAEAGHRKKTNEGDGFYERRRTRCFERFQCRALCHRLLTLASGHGPPRGGRCEGEVWSPAFRRLQAAGVEPSSSARGSPLARPAKAGTPNCEGGRISGFGFRAS